MEHSNTQMLQYQFRQQERLVANISTATIWAHTIGSAFPLLPFPTPVFLFFSPPSVFHSNKGFSRFSFPITAFCGFQSNNTIKSQMLQLANQ